MSEKKLSILETIKVSSFLAFIISFMIFMWFSKVEEVFTLKVHITIWVVAWVVMLIFGFSKGSVIGFVLGLAKILFSKELTADDKVGILMGIIQEALDVTAYLSMLAQEKEKELEKKDDELKEI